MRKETAGRKHRGLAPEPRAGYGPARPPDPKRAAVVAKAIAARRPRLGVLPRLLVSRLPGQHWKGRIVAGPWVLPCWLGRRGISRSKREGDGATPAGRHALAGLLHRADRCGSLASTLPRHGIGPDDGWCDDPRHRRYNTRVRLPFAASSERLHRGDGLYDVVLILDYNLVGPRPGCGSAIFIHVGAPDPAPTAGCVSLRRADLLRLLPRLSARTAVLIS